MPEMEHLLKHLEEDVKTQGKYHQMLTSIGDGIIALDKRLRVTEINDTALNFFHKRKSSVTDKPYWRFFQVRNEHGKKKDDEIRHALRDLLHKARGRKKVDPKHLKRVYVHIPSEGITPIAVSLALIYSDTGSVQGAVISFRSIEEEVEVSQMKSTFVSLTAHQLRAPLTSIRWNIEYLMGGGAGSLTMGQQEVMRDIYESNARMIRLINDLLNISRIEEGRIRVEPSPSNIKVMIDEAIKEVASQARAMNRKVEFTVDKSVTEAPIVSIDKQLIFQVLRNLISNAVKYAATQGGQVKINLSKEKFSYRVSVWDNGIGIPANAKKKIFTKFFRAENANDVDPLGSGLGLYLVKMIVKVSGGSVGFGSTSEKGTLFYFTLPLKGSPANLKGKRFSELKQ